MFLDSAELYDAIYHFKNYARECERLRDLIEEAVPGARTILDVECGTGEHAKFLKEKYAVDGVDLNEQYLRAARSKNPAGNYTCADMTNFDLGRTYYVVICLFSAIGHVKSVERLYRGVACEARGTPILDRACVGATAGPVPTADPREGREGHPRDRAAGRVRVLIWIIYLAAIIERALNYRRSQAVRRAT